jgi:serine/threonine protein kinase
MKGTVEYVAPEMIQKEEYGYAVDFFSLGLVIYEMLTRGEHPFKKGENANNKEITASIVNEEIPMKSYFSSNAVSVIRGLTEKDENMRLGASNISELKQHPFFKGIQWEEMSKN